MAKVAGNKFSKKKPVLGKLPTTIPRPPVVEIGNDGVFISLWVARRHRPFTIVEDDELIDIFTDLTIKWRFLLALLYRAMCRKYLR